MPPATAQGSTGRDCGLALARAVQVKDARRGRVVAGNSLLRCDVRRAKINDPSGPSPDRRSVAQQAMPTFPFLAVYGNAENQSDGVHRY